jgi:hypothetical protein
LSLSWQKVEARGSLVEERNMGGKRACLALLMATGAECVYGQQQGSTQLAVRVAPEAYLNPRKLVLRFTIRPDGSPTGDEMVDVRAMVRALAGQTIEIATAATDLQSDSSMIPASNLYFRGVRTVAKSGAESATCGSGALQETKLVTNWVRSGVLNCAVAFSLKPGQYTPGTYTTTVTLDLVIR